MVAVRMNGQSSKHQKRQDESERTQAARTAKPVRTETPFPPDSQTDMPADGQVIAEKGDALGGPA
jgi:hypothetical protein